MKKIAAAVLALVLGLSASVASAQTVTVQGTVGNGYYSITSHDGDRYRNRHRYSGPAFESRRECERSLNYDRGYQHRRAHYRDRLVQCEPVYVRVQCYAGDYYRADGCYSLLWVRR